MKSEAVRHTGTYPDIYLTDRQTLVVTLRTAKRDVNSCSIYCFPRTNPEHIRESRMEFAGRDGMFDYYRISLRFGQVARYQKYYFKLESADGTAFFSANGFHDHEPQDGCFEFLYANCTGVINLPEWTQGQVFYQVFPERFSNGDSSNDPPEVQPWGTKPDRENYMGGDLKGIRDHLDYIRDLGADCIYLNPVFCGDFNHKYATTDYYRIDPEFGTNEDMKNLVKDVHDKGMRIILDGVFNHCGIHFEPLFKKIVSSSDY